jgi:hypothetical protein
MQTQTLWVGPEATTEREREGEREGERERERERGRERERERATGTWHPSIASTGYAIIACEQADRAFARTILFRFAAFCRQAGKRAHGQAWKHASVQTNERASVQRPCKRAQAMADRVGPCKRAQAMSDRVWGRIRPGKHTPHTHGTAQRNTTQHPRAAWTPNEQQQQ